MVPERKVIQAEVGPSKPATGFSSVARVLRVTAPCAVALAVAALTGCSGCWNDGYARARSHPASASTRPSKPITPPARTSAARDPNVLLPNRVLRPENEARFIVLPDTEVSGRSRTYTGEPSDPDTCAAQCLANRGCDAFAFSKETKVCYLVTQVTQSSPDSTFISGRLR